MVMETIQKNGTQNGATHGSDLAVMDGETSIGSALEPQTMKQMWWLCQQLVGTGFLPDAIQKPGQALAIIMAGRELGLGPMQSLRGIDIIKGKIRLSAATQLGLMLKAGVKVRWVRTDDKAAILELSRPGHEPKEFSFTIEMAQRAKLSGDNWQKYPDAMLRARVISSAGKAYCPDILDGVYDPDEIPAANQAPLPAPTVEVHEPENKQRRTASVKERLAKPVADDAPPPPPSDDGASQAN